MKNILVVFILTMFLTVLLSGCTSTGDWKLYLQGTSTSSGSIGYVIESQTFQVEAAQGDTARDIGPKLAALIKASGLIVEVETDAVPPHYQDQPYYAFVVKNLHQQPVSKTEVLGISVGISGPLQQTIAGIKPQ
jgi:hypothetical protein